MGWGGEHDEADARLGPCRDGRASPLRKTLQSIGSPYVLAGHDIVEGHIAHEKMIDLHA